MKKHLLIIITILGFSITTALAQKITVKGTVTDAASNEGIPGASVRVKGTSTGTATDASGQFTISASINDQLTITYTGYKTLTITVSGASVNVKLEKELNTLNEVVLIGTRSAGRVKLETAVPVDVVNVAKASLTTGRLDLTDILNYSAPSFNYNKQSGSDGADHVELGTLRGLGPDQTLVLINGKRRHQTAFVSVFGTRGRGNSGTDLSSIPAASIDRVEILRDGASAQYGSDAIAGVINIVLKKNVNEFTINGGYSAFYDPAFNSRNALARGQYPHGGAFDGNAVVFDANYGVALGKNNGFINFSADYANNGKTFRQTHDTAFANPKALPLNNVRRANGDGSANSFDLFFNSELPIAGTQTTFYSFGGYSRKNSDDYAFTRNFSGSPGRFPTDAGGNLIAVPGIIFNTPDGESYYNPIIQTHNTDASLALGLKGIVGKDVNWDLSNNTGNNSFHFFGDKTFNASKGADKTHFDDGGSQFLQNTTNLNFSKHLKDVFAGLNIGAGAEYRYERYKINAGEPDSYSNYNEDKATGSQGFPGYQPTDAVKAHRSVEGIYLDLEADITKEWLIDYANRLEHYSDFGFNYSTKFATRYKITDNFNLRGSVGTGFRAPSLQQINYSSSYTNVQGGVISEVKIAPNYSPITKAAGIPNLKQETSTNAGIGFTYRPIPELSITTDGYLIKVKDRVVLSGQFSASDQTLDPTFIAALDALHVSAAQFFANAVNTTNTGLDLVIEYNKKIGDSRVRVLFAGNFQHMKINKINYPEKLSGTDLLRQTFLSDREQDFILASAPPQKLSLNPEYSYKKFTAGTRFTYFGKVTLLGYGENFDGIHPVVPLDADANTTVPDQYVYSGKVVSDLYFSYKLSKTAHVSIGSDNIFNIHPVLGAVIAAKGYAYNNETGGPFDAVQMGENGRRVFVRLGFNF